MACAGDGRGAEVRQRGARGASFQSEFESKLMFRLETTIRSGNAT